MKRTILILTSILLAINICHAQEAELYISVLHDTFGTKFLQSYPKFDLTLSYDGFEQKDHYMIRSNKHCIYKNVPEGPVHVKIDFVGDSRTRAFSDSINVHKGINAIYIQLDNFGEHNAIKHNDPLFSKDFSYENTTPIKYNIPKPTRPKSGEIDGMPVLFSNIFYDGDRVEDPATDILSKKKWAESVTDWSDVTNSYLILRVPDLHWSWKNNVLVIWKD